MDTKYGLQRIPSALLFKRHCQRLALTMVSCCLFAFSGYSQAAYDVNSATFTQSKILPVVNPEEVNFSTNGLKMFVHNIGRKIHEYPLTSAFDVSTIGTKTAEVAFGDGSAIEVTEGILFNADGTRVYDLRRDGDVYEYTLSVGFDITSTLTPLGNSERLVFSGIDYPAAHGMTFNNDGTKLYILARNSISPANYLFQFNLSTAYDVSTGTFIARSSKIEDLTGVPYNGESFYGITTNANSTKFYVNNSTTILEFALTGDVSTTNFTYVRSIANGDSQTQLRDVFFNSDGSKFYTSSYDTRAISEYSIPLPNPPTFTSAAVTTVNNNATYSYDITTSDVDGDAVKVTATTLPSWLSLTISAESVSTFVGTGTAGTSNGTGTNAALSYPNSIVKDANGNFYVSEEITGTIREITPNGVTSLLAGSGTAGYADGTGSAASFRRPGGMAIDDSGNIYVAEIENHRIRKIDPNGVVTTIAGSGTRKDEDGTGTGASFDSPFAVAIDPSGNLYVGANFQVKKITPNGEVTSFAGSNNSSGNEDGTGTEAKFGHIYDIKTDDAGNLYVVNGATVKKVTQARVVTTLAGSNGGYTDGTGDNAQFNQLSGIAFGDDGYLYVSEFGNRRIRKISPEGVVTTFVGTGNYAYTDGSAAVASFRRPSALIVTDAGEFIVADATDHVLRIIKPKYTLEGNAYGLLSNQSVSLTADDQNGGEATQNFTIEVSDVLPSEVQSLNLNSANDFLDITFNEGVYNAGNHSGALEKTDLELVLTEGTATNPVITSLTKNDNSPLQGGESVIRVNFSFTHAADGTESLTANPASNSVFDGAGNAASITQSNNTATLFDDTLPIFTSGTSVDFPENQTYSPYTAVATDARTITYSFGGGSDASLFNLDVNTGKVSFKTPPDFESPSDFGTDNTYDIIVNASDGVKTTHHTVSISVTGLTDEVFPVITSGTTATFVENATGTIYTASATDNNGVSYSLGNDNDEVLFAIDPGSGDLTFVSPPNFEAPADADKNNEYIVEIAAYDGSNTSFQTVTISVTGVAEGPSFTTDPVLAVSSNADYTYDIGVSDPEGDNVTVTATTLPGWLSVKNEVSNVGSTLAGVTQNYGTLDGIGTDARFQNLYDLAVDDNENVYIIDQYRIRKITKEGVVTSLAGSKSAQGTAEGTGTDARFQNPKGIAVDASGNVYVSDQNKIRKVTPAGVTSTFVGSSSSGTTDGNGTAATLYEPYGLAFDTNGILWVVQTYSNELRKVTPAGDVTTFTINNHYTNETRGIALDAAGNIYLAGYYDYTNFKVTPDGTVTDIGGNGNTSESIAVDAAGNVYFTDDNSYVTKIDPQGTKSRFIGSGTILEGGTGINADLGLASHVVIDKKGNLYMTDSRGSIKKTTAPGPQLAGNSTGQTGAHAVTLTASDGNGGSATQSFNINIDDAAPTFSIDPFPPIVDATSILMGLGLNEAGKAYYVVLADGATAPSAEEVKAGTGSGGAAVIASGNASVGGQIGGFSHSFDVTGLTEITAYDIYVIAEDEPVGNLQATPFKLEVTTTDGTAPVFTSLTIANFAENGTGTVYTVAATDANAVTYSLGTGNDESLFAINGGVITFVAAPDFEAPGDGDTNNTYVINVIATDVANNAANQNVTITVTDVVENASPVFSSTPVTSVNEGDTYAYTLDFNDADGDNVAITAPTKPDWLSFSSETKVSTLVGTTRGFANGTGTAAQFDRPRGVAVDGSGNVYVTDTENNTIRKITAGGIVTTLAGSTTSGTADGSGVGAQFNAPHGIAVDGSGNVYVADRLNHSIRKITAAGVVTTVIGGLSYPQDVAIDASGDLYITDSGNHKILKITASGVVSTFAGSTYGFAQGTGTAAKFSNPSGIAIGPLGNLYVTDTNNYGIRKITPDGVVTLLAGHPSGSYNPGTTDGTGASARFHGSQGITVDTSGNLYVVDNGSHRIRKVTPGGVVTTFAGSTQGFADGDLSASQFYAPQGIEIDAAGDLYITDWFNDRIRQIKTSTLFSGSSAGEAGNHSVVLTANDGKGGTVSQTFTITVLAAPTVTTADASAIAATSVSLGGDVSASGDGTVSERGIVYSVTSTNANPAIGGIGVVQDDNGTGISTFTESIAGLKSLTQYSFAAYATSNIGTAYGTVKTFTTTNTAPTFSSTEVTSVNEGDTYTYTVTANDIDGDITSITAPTLPDWLSLSNETKVSTFVGTTQGHANGTGTSAQFYKPEGVAVDGSGTVYVADTENHTIRKITAAGVVTTLAGSTTSGTADGTGTGAQFNKPAGLAVDGSGNVYVADRFNNSIRKITAAGVVTTVAGGFTYPRDVAIGANGDLYIAGGQSHKIHKITPAGGVTTFAGSTTGFANGTGTSAQFGDPSAIAIDASGNMYVADANNSGIRKITPDGVVTLFVGHPSGGYNNDYVDGTGGAARFAFPRGLTLDDSGNLYVVDNGNNRIRKITPSGVVTTIAGSTQGFADGATSSAQFYAPYGIEINAEGVLYIADWFNNRIRQIKTSTILSGPSAGKVGNHSVVLTANDGKGGTVNQSFTVAVNDVTNPVLTSLTTATFAENGTGTAYTIVATDANAITYSLGAGNDESLFAINSGLVTFINSPDFETPGGNNADNTYVINVIASDGVNSVNQNVTITVTDVDEVPPTVSITDAETIEVIHGAITVVVQFSEPVVGFVLEDIEIQNVTLTNFQSFFAGQTYSFEVNPVVDGAVLIKVPAAVATDQAGNPNVVAPFAIEAIMERTAPVFTSPTTVDFAENGTGTAYTVVATDANAITYSLGTGNDESLFAINGGLVTFLNSPDFETPGGNNTDNTYVINVIVSDGVNSVNQNVTITVTDVDEVPPTVSITDAETIEVIHGAITVVVQFSEPVVGFVLEDIEIQNVTLTNFQSFFAGQTYTFEVNPVADGAFLVRVPVAVATDQAGNLNTAAPFAIEAIMDRVSPVFTSPTAVGFAENGTGTAYTIVATDANATTYSLGTGNDESLFAINGGLVTFINSPDFETPGGNNADNTYVINVIASDGTNASNQNVTITVTDVVEDFTGPVLTASNPADDGTDFSGSTLTFTFDENIVKGTGRISVFDAADDSEISGAGVGSARVTVSGNTATFDLINPLPLDKAVYVRIPVGAFKDALGNTFSGMLDKTTLNFASPSTPKLTSSNPADDAIDVTGTTITLTFDRNIVKGTGRISLFNAADDTEVSGAGVGSARVTIADNVVTFDLINALPENMQVYLSVPPAAFKDANDRFFLGITDKTTLNFATPTTPQLVSSTPADEATNVAGTTLTFTFDRNVLKGTGRISVYDAADDSEINGAGVGSARISIVGNVVTYDLVNALPLNKQVYVKIPASALKDANNSFFLGIMDKTTLNFAAPTSPQLVSSTPADGATNVGGTTLTFTFDRNVVKGTGRISIYDAANDTEINGAGVGSTRISIAGNVVTYDLVNALPLDKQVYVKIPGSAFKDANNVFYQGVLDNTTLNFASPTTPQLVSSNPADEASEFTGNSLMLTFDRNLIKGTGRISIKDAADDSEITGAGVGSARVTIVNNVVTVDLINPLPLNKQVYVTVPGGAFKDANNKFYKGIFDKTTLNFSSQSSPQLVSSNPADEAVDFTGTTVTLTFDRNVIKGTGRISVLDVTDDSEVTGAGVGSTRISITDNVVTFDLINALPTDKQVYLKIPGSAFKDVSDVFYAGMLDKTTLNFASPTTPQITATNPLDDATDFNGTTITFTFDRDVIKGSGRLSVFNAADDTEITGAGVASGRVTVTANVVTFNLINALPAGTNAYVKVPASAFKDASNRFYKGMLDKTTLNFTTTLPAPENNALADLGELTLSDDVAIALYPNPANQVITLDLTAAGEEPSVRITDATGAQKFNLDKVEQSKLSIDVSQYAGGMYIAIIRTSTGQLIRKKFMIRR